MGKLKLYGVHPISGLSADEVFSYYQSLKTILEGDFDVFLPMFGKGSLRTEKKFRTAGGYSHLPISTNHAIFERDRWMVQQADIIYANLIGAKEVSIGSCFELAWASVLGKYTVVAMDKENAHQHAFVLEAADVIFDNHSDATDYLLKLARKEF